MEAVRKFSRPKVPRFRNIIKNITPPIISTTFLFSSSPNYLIMMPLKRRMKSTLYEGNLWSFENYLYKFIWKDLIKIQNFPLNLNFSDGPLTGISEIFVRFCIFKITGRWRTLTEYARYSQIPSSLHKYRYDYRIGDMVAFWDGLFYDTAPPNSSASDTDTP